MSLPAFVLRRDAQSYPTQLPPSWSVPCSTTRTTDPHYYTLYEYGNLVSTVAGLPLAGGPDVATLQSVACWSGVVAVEVLRAWAAGPLGLPIAMCKLPWLIRQARVEDL